MKSDLFLQSFFPDQLLQVVAVFFTVAALHLGMGRSENDVEHFGKFGGHLLHGGDGVFDPLVGAQQAECEKHSPPSRLESVLVERRIEEGDIGSPVGNHQDLGRGNAVHILQQLHRHLRLHHHNGGELADAAQGFLLPRQGFGENGMKRGHHRFFQRAEQMDDVAAVLSAENTELMLQADRIYRRDVDEISSPLVITPVLITDVKTDITAVTVILRAVVQGNHFEDTLIVIMVALAVNLAKTSGQIRCICGNAAAARRICRDESHLQRLEQATD